MKLIVLALLAAAASAQNVPQNQYIAVHTATLSGGTDKVTVQQPAAATGGPNKSVKFISGVIYCSVACTATLSQNGTAATATTLATIPLNQSPPSNATAWSSSNVGGGTSILTYNIPTGGGTLAIDLSRLQLSGGSASNLSIGIASVTGSTSIAIQWSEQ